MADARGPEGAAAARAALGAAIEAGGSRWGYELAYAAAKAGYAGKQPRAENDPGRILVAQPPDQRVLVAAENLPSSAREILQNRKLDPDGSLSIGIPDGYVTVRAENGAGVVYRKAGTTGNANTIRVMLPNRYTPYPYVRVFNANGQPIDPVTGRTGSNDETHYELKNLSEERNQ